MKALVVGGVKLFQKYLDHFRQDSSFLPKHFNAPATLMR